MSERTVEIKTHSGKLIVTEREALHGKSKKMLPYLSFSDGQNAMGVYLDKETKKELSKFLNKKENASGE